jgi:LytS/YehU family sensor histidine kinase
MTFTFVSFASIGSYLNWRSIQRIKEKLELEENLILKELNFVKEQFNSHFTLNFFNYCYNTALYKSSEAADAITSFTGMLLYSIKNESNEYISVKEEMEYIENFVSVQRCITNNVFIEVSSNGSITDYYILPGIISTFVENSFKHGIFDQEDKPITIFLTIEIDILTFIIKNKKTNKRPLHSTGIGLEEVLEVLKLFYPDKHSFEVEDNECEYCSTLKLKLTPIS